MFHEIRLRLRFSIISCLLVLFIYFCSFFNTNVNGNDLISLWGFFIFIWFLFTIFLSLSCLLEFKNIRWKSFIPLLIQIFFIFIFISIHFVLPIGVFKEKYFFLRNEIKYNEVVIEIINDKKFPRNENDYCVEDDCTVNISAKYKNISEDNRITIEKHNGNYYVLFYTYSGILHSYRGYLYVPDGGYPEEYDFLYQKERSNITFIKKNWYVVGHSG